MSEYEPMDPEAKQRWTKALRSGKYKQGQKALHCNEGKFCCLGVFADIEHDGYWELIGGTWGIKLPHFERATFHSSGSLPAKFRDQFGLHEEAQGELITMNDSGVSFKEIADWIEENL